MRALSSLAVLALLGASGAVIAMKVAAPDATPPGGRVPASSPAAAAIGRSRQTTPAPVAHAEGGPIRLIVRNPGGRLLVAATVGTLDPTRVHGSYAPIDPPAWDQPVWVRYRPLVPPDDTARGTSYVYGHACHHHVCAFTRLHRVRAGAAVLVKDGRHTVRYVVARTSADFPKTGPRSLAHRTSGVADRDVRNRLVLITCAYERGDVSLNNFVVVAVRRQA